MSSKAKRYFKYDLYRYYAGEHRAVTSVLSSGYQLPFLRALRYAQFTENKLFRFLYRIRLRSLQKRTSMNISWRTKIGKGFYIGHVGPIAINEKAVIGDNCNISFGVVIGADNRGIRKGSPIIGNQVWIGTNAVVVGNITIGDDVLIAPGSFVNFDVPPHSVVIGNPGVIHKKDNATAGFISNVITEADE